MEPNSRLIALDPGGTTGWATHSWFDLRGEVTDRTWQCGQLTGDHHNTLDVWLGNQQVANYIIICESFQQYRELDSPELVSLEYIGVVKRFCQEREVHLVLQSSSQGKVGLKSFVRRQNLVRLGLWSPGQRHAMDAYGHLLTYMINHGGCLIDYRRELLRQGWS
jgi:hypothetical protein